MFLKVVKFLLMVAMALVGAAEAQGQFAYTINADNTITITGYTGPPWCP